MLPLDMSVRGSLRTMSVEDLLDWIDRRLINGTLTVEKSSVVRSFAFDSGYLVNAASNVPGEQPAQLFLGAGLIEQDALEKIITDARSDENVSLSTLLEHVDDIDELQLRIALEEQATESLLDTLVWDKGVFVVETAEDREITVDFPISVRLRGCIVQGRQRSYRWRKIRQLIPSDEAILYVEDRLRLAMDEDSEEALEDILELTRAVESGWTVMDILEQWPGRRFMVLDRLALLMERGGLALAQDDSNAGEVPEAVEEATTSPSTHPPVRVDDTGNAAGLERAARAQAQAGNMGNALELTRQALVIEPEDEALKRLHRELERSLFAELSRDFLTAFRVPKLLVDRAELNHLDLSDTERYLAGRVDGRWDLLSLMRVAPVREVEALITFKRLADRGIISL